MKPLVDGILIFVVFFWAVLGLGMGAIDGVGRPDRCTFQYNGDYVFFLKVPACRTARWLTQELK